MKRSKWKGIYAKPENYKNQKISLMEIPRNSSITPTLIEKTFRIYNGRNFKSILVTKNMLGHKFGEFFKTRVTFEFKKKKKKKKK